MNLKAYLTALVGLIAWSAFAWDFEYGYQNVFSPNADAYLLSQVYVDKVRNGVETFYRPNSPLEGKVTYRFHFDTPISDAYLHAQLWTDFFPETLTYSDLYASKDGQNWQLLVSAPYQDLYDGIFYDQHLPLPVLGADDIYIQSRLRSDTTPNFAQFSRADDRVPGDIFQFKATLIPEPSVTALAAVGALSLICLLIFEARRPHYK